MGFLTQSVYKMHDRAEFEVFCYTLSPDDQSAQRRMISSEAEHFKDISSLKAADAARLIHSDGM